MELTDRQQKILFSIVEGYIESAEPVSSGWLEKKYKINISPATIRNEMAELSESGFLFQPHISAGRVPTDKGYRFFVEMIFEGRMLEKKAEKMRQKFEELIENTRELAEITKIITRKAAAISSNLAVGYSIKGIFFEGWREIFEEPEFEEAYFRNEFIAMLDKIQNKIPEMAGESAEIFIGRENPFSKSDNFGLIISPRLHIGTEDAILVIVGPKRLDYKNNLAVIEAISRI